MGIIRGSCINKEGLVQVLDGCGDRKESKKISICLDILSITAEDCLEVFDNMNEVEKKGIVPVDPFIGGLLRVNGEVSARDLLALTLGAEAINPKIDITLANIARARAQISLMDMNVMRMSKHLQEHYTGVASVRPGQALLPAKKQSAENLHSPPGFPNIIYDNKSY